jgi:hypothetical protein
MVGVGRVEYGEAPSAGGRRESFAHPKCVIIVERER